MKRYGLPAFCLLLAVLFFLPASSPAQLSGGTVTYAAGADPAKRIGAFSSKGSLAVGKDADLLILSPDLEIESVMAKGRLLIRQNQFLVKGTFEKGT